MREDISRWARAAVDHVARGASGGPLDPSMRVTVNFHPERLVGADSVLRLLGRDGVYRSQFETGTSNGGLTARPGGARWNWEQRIFGGAYDDAPAAERPKYGALNHRRRSVGAAPRFGSAHLRLTGEVLARTTFCFPDSVLEPKDFATAGRFDLVRLADEFDRLERTDDREATEGGQLDDYIEAHVHGVIELSLRRRGTRPRPVLSVYRDREPGARPRGTGRMARGQTPVRVRARPASRLPWTSHRLRRPPGCGARGAGRGSARAGSRSRYRGRGGAQAAVALHRTVRCPGQVAERTTTGVVVGCVEPPSGSTVTASASPAAKSSASARALPPPSARMPADAAWSPLTTQSW